MQGSEAQQQTPLMPQEEDSAQAAVAHSEALNAALLESQTERSFADLQVRHQQLMKRCSDYQSQVSNLQASLEETRGELKTKSDELDSLTQQQKRDKVELQRAQEREKDVSERMVRVDVEADSLRQEISRLTASNQALSAQITQLETSAKLSTSSSAPLQFENSRLKTEISSLTAHCSWLEGELNSRSNQNAEEKMKNARLIQDLRTELNIIKAEYDEAISKVSILGMQNETQRKRVEMGQKELLQKEQDHADIVHELNMEIYAERKLVALNKENYARLEERYNDAVREMKSMKELAIAAEKDRQEEILAIREQVESYFHKLLAEAQEENLKQIQEYQQELDAVTSEKTDLEDKFMAQNSNRGAIGLGQRSETLELTDGEPMTLTALYGKLADAQDEVRKERAERKRLELYLERVHEDIEREAPRQRQERKEYQLAMAQNHDLHSRLNEALDESNSARREIQHLQRELTDITKECYELRMENKDMAMQVQHLLQKSIDGEDLAEEIQTQNQRLAREYNRMSLKISELQKRIDDDNVQQQLEELESLRSERNKQAVLVANIVHQRDLYRALLNKNDQHLLAEYGADGAIVAAKDQIEKFTDLESRNKELEQTLTKLNAEMMSMTNEKVGLNEKISRLDAVCSDLSSANNRLEADLCASHAANARNNAETKFYKEKVERLEESLEMVRDDLGRANDEKKTLQRMFEELQTMLSTSKEEQSKLESQLRAISMQLRLVETNAKSFKDEETRLHAENNSLRSELARYISLHDSIQKIESSLSMRGNEEQHFLKEENVKLTETLQTERSNHSLELEGLKNQLGDAEIRIRQTEKEKNEALVAMSSLRERLDVSNVEIKSITEKYIALQNSVNEVGNKSGTSGSEKEVIEDLSQELAKVKSDLEAALKKVHDYKLMAQSSENSLKSTVEASEDFKKSALLEIEKLKRDLQTASDNVALKQSFLDEAVKEVETSRTEFNKNIEDLNATILTLRAELESSRLDKDASEKQRDSVLEEMHIYRNEANAAKDNYERELALHADARKELHTLRMKLNDEIHSHIITKDQLKDLENHLESGKKSWEDTSRILRESQKNTESRLVDAQNQIEILHNQISRLSQSLEKAQAGERATHAEGEEEQSTQNETVLRLEKEVCDLRQVTTFQQNEKKLIDAQLESARRSAERERAAAEIAKRSLQELRAEFEREQNEVKDVVGSSNLETTASLQTKLKVAEDQVVLLRESNKMLRLETEKLGKTVEALKNQINDAQGAFEPIKKKCAALEVANSGLEAEKASLSREVEAWRERVQGLLKKFNQIDPEEHSTALKKVEEAEHRASELLAAKEKAEKETAAAKSLVSRLNKELLKMRSTLETSNASLNQAKSENEELVKNNSGSIDVLKKEIEDTNKMKEKVEKELGSAKLEIVALSSRLENLKNISRSNKAKVLESQKSLESALKKEREISRLLEEEKEAHKAALQLAERLQATAGTENGTVVSAMSQGEKGKGGIVEEASKGPEILQAASTRKEDLQTDIAESADSRSTALAEHGAVAKESRLECVQDGAIPLPKVPDGGFNFVPSKASTKLTELAESILQSSDVRMDEPGNIFMKDIQDKSESGPTVTLKSNVAERAEEEVKRSNDSNQITTPASNMDSLREKLLQKKKRALELKTGAPPAKRHAPVDKEKTESMADGAATIESSVKNTSETSQSEVKGASCTTQIAPTMPGATETLPTSGDCATKTVQNSSSDDIAAIHLDSDKCIERDDQFLVEDKASQMEEDKTDRTGSSVSSTANPVHPTSVTQQVHDSVSESTELLPSHLVEAKESGSKQQDDSCKDTTMDEGDSLEEKNESTTDLAGTNNKVTDDK